MELFNLDLCLTELLEIELFYHLTVCKQKLMCDYIVCDTEWYLELFNFDKIELLEIGVFDHLTVYLQIVFSYHIFNMNIKRYLVLNDWQRLICHKPNQLPHRLGL